MTNKNTQDNWTVAGKEFSSRLIVGTGKYKSFQECRSAIEASGAEIVTVAVKRVNVDKNNGEMLQDYIDPTKYTYLPNTAGCFDAKDAVRTLRLAYEIGGWDLVKLEVLSDPKTLYPNMLDTLKAAEELIKHGFKVMVYCTDDIVLCKELENIGCVAIMPLGAPIGSGRGIQNELNIKFIIEQTAKHIPVIVDAGVGTTAHATRAMELGCSGVLMNSAIAHAKDPITMAQAMKLAIKAGRLGYLSGFIDEKEYAIASSPLGK